MQALFTVIDLALSLYMWVLIILAVLSWLFAFNVVNRYNQGIMLIYDFCTRLTEPVLRQIRRYVKPYNGLDLSALILILGVYFLRLLFREYGLILQ